MFLQGWLLPGWVVITERAPPQSASSSCSCHDSILQLCHSPGDPYRSHCCAPKSPKAFLYTLPSIMYSVTATENRQLPSLGSAADDELPSWEHVCTHMQCERARVGKACLVAGSEQHTEAGDAAEALALLQAARSHDWTVLCPQKRGRGHAQKPGHSDHLGPRVWA